MHDNASEGQEDGPVGCPTPTEIAEHCRQIQSDWSATEFYTRAGKRPPVWLCGADDVRADAWAAPVVGLGDDVRVSE